MIEPERRIRRLLRWYPKQWRESHVEEFSVLLEDSISERPLWPRRGIDIAIEGSKLRLGALGAGLAAVWPLLSFAIFVIYAILFATVSLPNASHGHFRSLFQVVGIVLASGLIAAGLLMLAHGAKSIRSTQSIRRSWPYVSLGSSLIALVGLDGWITHGAFFWGENAIQNGVISLDPTSWRYELSQPFGWYQIYLPINLILIILITASAVVIGRRTRAPLTRAAPVIELGVLIVMTVTAAASWTWAINAAGAYGLPDRYFIPCMITLASVSTLLARLHRAPRQSQGPDGYAGIGSGSG
jgi:hypothetical protein